MSYKDPTADFIVACHFASRGAFYTLCSIALPLPEDQDRPGRWLAFFVNPEDAMRREPGHFGWYANEPKHVDCPRCIERMPQVLKEMRRTAMLECAAAMDAVKKLDEQVAEAEAKAKR